MHIFAPTQQDGPYKKKAHINPPTKALWTLQIWRTVSSSYGGC